MTSLREALRRIFRPPQPLPAGAYHFQAPPESPLPYRLHLRIEADGNGILIVNAATVLHLNQTAAEYAYHLVQNATKDSAARAVAERYRINFSQARQDFLDFSERVHALVETTDLDPVAFLGFDRQAPYSQVLSAPYRLDCALTYRLPEEDSSADTRQALAPTRRVERELETAEWQRILDKAWQAGIPHIIFTGGEPTLRQDLPALIRHAEQNGQVSGLLTDGLRLADPAYLDSLLQTGLDHLMFILQPGQEMSWTSLAAVMAADLAVTVHLTLTKENTDRLAETLNRLAALSVKTISLSASDPALNAALQAGRDQAAGLGLSLTWDLPVPYSAANPIALETVEDEMVEGAGRGWLYVEPDGDVLPGQGINRVLGNLERDPWAKVWEAASK